MRLTDRAHFPCLFCIGNLGDESGMRRLSNGWHFWTHWVYRLLNFHGLVDLRSGPPMMNCCFLCVHAGAGWVRKDGRFKADTCLPWYERTMNIYCNHPVRGGNGQCLPIAWKACEDFKLADTPSIEKRKKFYSQFSKWSFLSKKIGIG